MLSSKLVDEAVNKSGGRKNELQRMVLNGHIDQLTATLAAMRINRIQEAAKLDQLEQPTVAEQVMNPQPQMPPQAMAAIPQAQQMPPQAQMGRPQAPQMQQPMPQQMAMGGGLGAIPYNEGSYAPGGVVSFKQGAALTKEQLEAQLQQAYMNAGSAQERAQIKAQIDNIAKMGTVTSPGGQAVTDSRLNQDASFTGAAPLATVELGGDVGVSDAGIPEGQFRGIRSGKTPNEKLSDLGTGIMGGLQKGYDAFTSAFSSGDMDEFNRLKNAQEVVDPAEQARRDRVALAMQTRGEGQNVIPVDNSDPFAIGMETFTDGQRATTPTEQTAPMRSQQIPTSLGPQVGRGQDPRLFGEGDERRKALAALAARNPDLIDPADGMKPEIRQMTREEVAAAGLPAIDATRTRGQEVSDAERFLSNEGFSVARQVAEQTPSVADRIEETEQAVTQPAPEPKPEKESKPADTTMDITEQFKVFDKELAGLMEKPEHGKYRKEMENLLGNREERLKEAKKEGFNMALLQAGLGMLAQGGGQTALQALGKAALPATKQYAAAVKDAKKEDRELLKLGLSMEQMDAKELAATKRTLATIYGSRANAMLQAAVSEANSIRGAESRERVAEITSKAQQGLSSAIRGSTAMASIENQLGDVRKESAEIRARVEFDNNADLLAARDALRNNPNDPAARQALADIQLIIDREIAAAEQKAGITDARNRLIAERNNLANITGSGSGNAIDYSSLVPK